MKKRVVFILILIFLYCFLILGVNGEDNIIVIKLQKNNKTAYLNDTPIQLDVAPIEIPPGRIMVPIRFISEGFGAKVFWDQKTETVSIYMDSALYYKNKASFLEQKVNTIEEENKNLKEQIEDLNNEKNDLILKNQLFQNKITELEQENNSLKEQINILKKQLEEYQKKDLNQENINKIYENNKLKVVSIENYDSKNNLSSRGTGFVVSNNGKVITNFHVIKNASYIIVKLINGRSYKIYNLINYDINRDLAIIKLPLDYIDPVILGDSDKVKVGDQVLVISNPLGLEHTLTNGVVSYVNRIINNQTWIQYTAPSSPGSSGGPVINMNGEVIGIVSLKISAQGVEGINFAIPINDAKLLLEKEKPVSFSDLFNTYIDSWDLSDEKILEAINLGKKFYNDISSLIDMFSIYSTYYSLLYAKTNVSVLTPYFWIAYNTANNIKSGKNFTIEDAYYVLEEFGKELIFMILVYGDSISFQKYYSVKLNINDKIISPIYSQNSNSVNKSFYYPKSPKYYAINFYTFDNTVIPRNSVVKLLISDGYYKQETITIDLSKFP